MNPFIPSSELELSDKELVQQTLNGEKRALNELVERHQPFIFNLAWKMVGNPHDAEDLSQEALIKIISNLQNFNFNSSFQTWAYRIVRNHFLNDQKKSLRATQNFNQYGKTLDAIPNVHLNKNEEEEQREFIKETRLTCMSGMLLCLTKEQRMIFIIGELFRANHTIGSEIMGISKANFRMKLSKARKDLVTFMQQKCGLVDKSNPCRCRKKVTVNLETGIINAKSLLYNRAEYSTFRQQLQEDADYLADESELKYLELHGDHSYKTEFEKKNFLVELLEDHNWKNRLNLN